MKATRKTIPTLIEQRQEFSNTSGTMYAVSNPGKETVSAFLSRDSDMDEDEKSRLRIDFDTAGIRYLIVSYQTPLAWENGHGLIYKVQQELTQTSGNHMDLLTLFTER